MTSNVRYDENLCVMASHVRNSERGAVLYDCIVLNNGVVTTYTKKDPARTIYAFLALQFSPQMLVYFSCTLYKIWPFTTRQIVFMFCTTGIRLFNA